MFPLGWTVLWVLLSAPLSLCSLEVIEAHSGVACSQGLNCTMTDGSWKDFNSVKVTDLKPEVKLCCSGHTCALCLRIEVKIDLDQPGEEEEGNSGLENAEDTEETKDGKGETGSVTVCYQIPELATPSCKKVEFTVNPDRPSQQSTAQISMVITNAVITYGSLVSIYPKNVQDIFKQVEVPSYKVCLSETRTYVQECNVSKVHISIVQSSVELRFPGGDSNGSVVCLQNETNGICKRWDGKPIPLESVTPCTCFQTWKENGKMIVHSRVCPFKNNTSLRIISDNTWRKFTASVEEKHMDNMTMVWWKISAPCRLQGEVQACRRTPRLTVCQGFKQQLEDEPWVQNKKGLWEKTVIFEHVNLETHPCVKIKSGDTEKGPFCDNDINRWRWSLFAVAVMLLLSLTLLTTFFLQNFIKALVRRCCHGGLDKIPKAHVLVVSPPDSDEEVSVAVSQLGSLLCSELLSVNVDLWSRKDQSSRGLLPWSHSQLPGVDSHCKRVVLVLTPKAVERAQAWSSQDCPIIGLQEDSPYADVFWASLFALQAQKNQGRASECFVLVTFESMWTELKIQKLPEILWGLPLFHFPSQTKDLLSNLCVKRTSNRLRQLDRRRTLL